MAESNVIFPLNHTGDFQIGSGAPGSVALRAVLTVPYNSSTVSGHGVLTQATNPPLHANNAFHGVVHATGLGPAKQLYSLQGSALPPLMGAPHVTHLLITLDGIWGTHGSATYQYVVGDVFHEVSDVPVKVTWLLQE